MPSPHSIPYSYFIPLPILYALPTLHTLSESMPHSFFMPFITHTLPIFSTLPMPYLLLYHSLLRFHILSLPTSFYIPPFTGVLSIILRMSSLTSLGLYWSHAKRMRHEAICYYILLIPNHASANWPTWSSRSPLSFSGDPVVKYEE